MTTPREHAALAAQLHHIANTRILSTEEIGALHTAANIFAAMPPIKRTITLTVNGREWVLPEPLRETPRHDQLVFYISDDGTVRTCRWNNWAVLPTLYKEQRLHNTEADAQAWADFNKWCRGGGV